MIVVAIAYTSALLKGQQVKGMGVQKYVVRPEPQSVNQRRHSAFYVGQQLPMWLQLPQLCQPDWTNFGRLTVVGLTMTSGGSEI